MRARLKYCFIPLRNKKKEIVAYATCSRDDFDELNQYRWHLKSGYAAGTVEKKHVMMHCHIMRNSVTIENDTVDHVNHNRLDNSRENLRVCSASDNSHNKAKRPNKKYHGVWQQQNGKFSASKGVDGTSTTIASNIVDESEAAVIFDVWCVHHPRYRQGFWQLNFPERLDEYKGMTPISRPEKKPKSSPYAGVYYDGARFRANVKINGKTKMLLLSSDPKECAIAFDKYVVENGLNRKINFPENHNGYIPILTRGQLLSDGTYRIFFDKQPDMEAFVDSDTYETIKGRSTWVAKGREGIWYVFVSVKGKSAMLLHRFILGLTNKKIYGDHINGNTLDNRKSNLRAVTPAQNSQNRRKRAGSTSEYLGVVKYKRSYFGSVTHNGVDYRKTFATQEYCARYRDLVIIKDLPGTAYKLNFEWTTDEVKHWTKLCMPGRNEPSNSMVIRLK